MPLDTAAGSHPETADDADSDPGVLVNASPVARRMWHPVATSDEVGSGPAQVWLCGQPWVLARLDGRLVGFADRCPHRLAPLSAGTVVDAAGTAGTADGTDLGTGQALACGYHGWRFDASGRCVLVPATGRTDGVSKRAVLSSPAGLVERYGLVWLAPEPPIVDVPDFPAWHTPGFDVAYGEVMRTSAGAAQLVDNFLDAAHFPFVHSATFGGAPIDPVDGGEVGRDGDTITALFATTYRDGEVASGAQPQHHTVRKTARAAYSVVLRLDLPATGVAMGILFACTPETATSTRVYKLIARNDLAGDPTRVADFVARQDAITREDLAILERYPDPALPLDPKFEAHTRVDRLSVAWRRLMSEHATQPGPPPAKSGHPSGL